MQQATSLRICSFVWCYFKCSIICFWKASHPYLFELLPTISWRSILPSSSPYPKHNIDVPSFPVFSHTYLIPNSFSKIRTTKHTLLASKNGGHCMRSNSRSAQYGTSSRSISLEMTQIYILKKETIRWGYTKIIYIRNIRTKKKVKQKQK